jgi:hypothetical protein
MQGTWIELVPSRIEATFYFLVYLIATCYIFSLPIGWLWKSGVLTLLHLVLSIEVLRLYQHYKYRNFLYLNYPSIMWERRSHYKKRENFATLCSASKITMSWIVLNYKREDDYYSRYKVIWPDGLSKRDRVMINRLLCINLL